MAIKSYFIKIIATVIAVVMITFAGVNTSGKYDVRDPENCALNFAVISDTHVEGNNFSRYKIFSQSLQSVKKHESGHDAVIFLGDNTMNGQVIENMFFHGTASVLLKGENVLPVLGNHDIGNGEGDYDKLQKRWYEYTKTFFGRSLEHPYYYDVIDGCYFIVLGMEAQEVYEMAVSEEQFAWLEGVLAEAAKSGKPAFVFSHYPMSDATDMDGNYTDRLTDMLAEYNELNDLFVFVGHTHMPLWSFWSFHNSDGFPETYLPRITDLGGDSDNEIIERSGVGIEVEVYKNEVLIRGRNFRTGEWVYEEDEDEGAFCEVTYQLKNPLD